jgi:hypothetical protein
MAARRVGELQDPLYAPHELAGVSETAVASGRAAVYASRATLTCA